MDSRPDGAKLWAMCGPRPTPARLPSVSGLTLGVRECGWTVAVVMEVTTSLLVYSRRLPLPGPGGRAGADALEGNPVAVGPLRHGVPAQPLGV
jgi:hypothetical protein